MAMETDERLDAADMLRIVSTGLELRSATFRGASRVELDAVRAKASSILEAYLDRQEEVANRRIARE